MCLLPSDVPWAFPRGMYFPGNSVSSHLQAKEKKKKKGASSLKAVLCLLLQTETHRSWDGGGRDISKQYVKDVLLRDMSGA